MATANRCLLGLIILDVVILGILGGVLSSCEEKGRQVHSAPSSPSSALAHAKQIHAQQRISEAIATIEDYAASRPKDALPTPKEVPLWVHWASFLLQAARSAEAEKVLLSLLKVVPDNRQARLMLAEAYVGQGACLKAVDVYQKLPPKERQAVLLVYGKAALDAGYSKEGASIAAAALIRDPWLDGGYLLLGRAIMRLGNEKAAERFLEKYRAGTPYRETLEGALELEVRGEEARAIWQRAHAEGTRGRLYEAMLGYNRSISKNAGSGPAYLDLARLSLFLERPHEAIAALKRIPQHAKVLELLGEAYEAIDELEAARKAYEDALQKDPGLADVKDRLERLGVRDSSVTPAEKEFEVLRRRVREEIRTKPLSASVVELLSVARGYRALGREEEARKLVLFLVNLKATSGNLRKLVARFFDRPDDIFVRLWALFPINERDVQTHIDRELAEITVDALLMRRALAGEPVVRLE